MKKILILLLVLAIVCTVLSVAFSKKESVPASIDVAERQVIIIDAGHGGLTNTIN